MLVKYLSNNPARSIRFTRNTAVPTHAGIRNNSQLALGVDFRTLTPNPNATSKEER
jgi:hypothetical protein